HTQRAPDLTRALPDHGFVPTLNKSPVIWTRPEVAGTPRPLGVVLAGGPGFRRGVRLAEQSITDVAATVLYCLGLPIPADFDGTVMAPAFDPHHLQSHPVRVGAPTMANRTDHQDHALSADDE